MQNIEEIYEQYSNTVYKYLFCLTHSDDISEELTQETFVIAVKEINKFKGECKVSVWLCQIAKHLWYKYLKKTKKESNIPLEEINDFAELETTEDIICKKEDKLKLFKDLQKLDEISREIIYLRMVGNLNFIEIGEILGKTPNWARVTFYRAKQKIKEVDENGKRTECQIVEDLLFGYVDGVLNTESKKMVEKHLIECENCKNRLDEIKSDIKENENNQKKQVDYLKKVRRKNTIKSILIAIGIIIFILFIMYLRNFIIFNNVLYKAKKSLSSNNMYIESASSFSENEKSVRKQYYKDGKYKEISGKITDEGFKIDSIIYTSVNSDEKITFLETPKKVRIEKGNNGNLMNSETNLKSVPLFVRDDRIIIRIIVPVIMSIKSEKNMPIGSYENWNKNNFKFKDKINEDEPGSREFWVDKETGLPLKTVNKDSRGQAFAESDIIKDIRDDICEYKYEFNIVTDEEVEIPSFDGYEIEYVEY